jgi:hypothetical protein
MGAPRFFVALWGSRSAQQGEVVLSGLIVSIRRREVGGFVSTIAEAADRCHHHPPTVPPSTLPSLHPLRLRPSKRSGVLTATFSNFTSTEISPVIVYFGLGRLRYLSLSVVVVKGGNFTTAKFSAFWVPGWAPALHGAKPSFLPI